MVGVSSRSLDASPRTAPEGEAPRSALLAYFQARGRLAVPEALDLILRTPTPLEVADRILRQAPPGPFLTREQVELFLSRPETPVPPEPFAPAPGLPSRGLPPPRETSSGGKVSRPLTFRLIREGYTPPSRSHDPLGAYAELFSDRFRTLGRILKGRPGLSDRVPLREIRSHEREVSAIVMVREVKRSVRQGHLLLEVEDDSSVQTVLIPRDSELASTTFLPDEVLGLRLGLPRDPQHLPVVREVLRPEVPAGKARGEVDREGRILFLSDIHVGSRMFLEDSWGELVDFLKGRTVRTDLAADIRAVVIAGDLVDGIGVYPGQEDDLAIHDVVEQYAELARRLREFPAGLSVVAVPGNHDAVCPAEPQPALPRHLLQRLPDTVHVLGNPSTFSLDGVVISAYHGRSFDDLIPALPGSRYERPTEVMKRMLSMRHLAPIYGGKTPLAPLPRDGLVLSEIPDLFVTGHTHTWGVESWRGILLLNASTWLAETEYQRMRNIRPVPARAIVVGLPDRRADTLDFQGRPTELGEAVEGVRP
jgi:DNA polymerase II small subunit